MKKVNKYRLEFKLRAVQLSGQAGVLIKDVAELLSIHPVMLSRWRKQVRDGELECRPRQRKPQRTASLERLRYMEKQLERLQMEHDALRIAARAASERKSKVSHSSRQSGKPAGST